MDNKKTFKVAAIDPGTTCLGLAYMDVSYDDFTIQKTIASTINLGKMVSENSWLAQVHSYRTARIYKLRELLIKSFNNLQPAIIVCESPFYNPRMPGAFAPLVEVLFTIKDSVIAYNSWMAFNTIDPSTIKKGVYAPGNADKTVMKKAVTSLKDLNFEGDVSIEDLDEHSIDAIAVGYCHVRELKNQALTKDLNTK